ncbi:MAG TPA: TetR/AcrR family transcriptional regulator [Gemmatimonadales bacterium]|jgi:AcrR family transcriptional regulator
MAMLPYDERLGGLLRTAAHVFARKGYHATTMRDLSRASGMSLAGMYHYVRGKEDLLYQIQQRCFTGVLTGAEEALARHTQPDQRLRAFVRHHLAFFAAQPAEMKVLSHEADSLTGKRAEEILRLKRRYADLLQGLVVAVDGDHASVAAYALFGMMNWTYTWYRPDGKLSPDALAQAFAELFLNGVRSPARPDPSRRPMGGRA